MKSLRLRISLIILVLMVTSSVLIAWIAISNAKKSLEKEMTQALVESVHATANSIQAMNDKEYKMLETLASLTDVKDPEVSLLDKCHIIYGAMSTNTDYIDVCILDTDGFAWINDGARKVPFKERKYFQEPLKKGTRFETDAFINKVTNAPAIFYSVPVYDKDKNIINVLFCVIDGLRLSELVVSHKAGDNRPASVISLSGGAGGENEAYSELHASGIVIAGESLLDKSLPLEKFATENIFERYDSKKNPGIMEELERIKTEQSGIIKYKEGEQFIMAFEKVPNANWAIVNTIPYSDFQNDINRMRNRIIIYVLIVVVISVLIVGFIISRSMKPLDTVKKAITDIATGNADLTKRIMIHSDDEIGAVVRGFNRFGEKLHRIISDIKISKEKLAEVGNNMSLNAKETADSITEVYSNIEEMQRELVTQGNSVQNTTSAVKEISSDIGTLEKLIETQSEGISQASSAIEQMIGNISSVNKSVENMAGSFEDLLKSTENGVGKQKTVGNKIKEIENKSAELKGANLVISEIATQTNLLAMNAAIEAAHAGDAGKGFSVVASEIKKLSENSQRESDKISDQLGSIIKSIEEVVAASNEATGALKQVSSLIDTTNDIVRQIRFAMEEQTSGSKEIGDALHTMNDTTSEVRRASVKMTTGNESILEEIKNLQEATETMKVSMDKIISCADNINRSGNELNKIAPEMKSSIDRISSQIDEFKI